MQGKMRGIARPIGLVPTLQPEDSTMPKTLRPLASALFAALATAPLAAYAQSTDVPGILPEPDSLWLVGLALGVMVWFGWRSRR